MCRALTSRPLESLTRFSSFEEILSSRRSTYKAKKAPAFPVDSNRGPVVLVPQSVRQLLTAEVERERVRRSEEAKTSRNQSRKFGGASASASPSATPLKPKPVIVTRLEPVALKTSTNKVLWTLSEILIFSRARTFSDALSQRISWRQRRRSARKRSNLHRIRFPFVTPRDSPMQSESPST